MIRLFAQRAAQSEMVAAVLAILLSGEFTFVDSSVPLLEGEADAAGEVVYLGGNWIRQGTNQVQRLIGFAGLESSVGLEERVAGFA